MKEPYCVRLTLGGNFPIDIDPVVVPCWMVYGSTEAYYIAMIRSKEFNVTRDY
jgi:hypothetical protein